MCWNENNYTEKNKTDENMKKIKQMKQMKIVSFYHFFYILGSETFGSYLMYILCIFTERNYLLTSLLYTHRIDRNDLFGKRG